MSYTLTFWAGGDDLDPLETCRKLDVEIVDGVRLLGRDEVDRALLDGLPGWVREGVHLHTPGADAEHGGSFEVHIGERIAAFVGYHIEEGEHFNAIIDAMRALGFRLFDPQTNERFS